MTKCKLTGRIDDVKHNVRYKLLHVNNEFYLIDLQKNILSYIFPMINWFPKSCYKIDSEAYEKLLNKGVYKKSNTSMIMGCIVLFSVLLRPLLNYVYAPISVFVGISMVLVALTLTVILQIFFRKKTELFKSNLPTTCKLTIIPKLKHLIYFIIFYVYSILFLLIGYTMLFIYKEINYLMYLAWFLQMIIFTFINIVSYNKEVVTVKLPRNESREMF
ncbi:DUF443 domain-containing protein [Staphylococcus agnetis]|uniref:DUF443 domain-containing protein n=1 Tax=Staphylococcus agnetis TaxID=985762 RepID=A0ABD7TQZ1_9STAP|nr:DUF443 domain-containing protein [Staphylococcus agnetis]UXU54070.1 DUF443 domain-containing protein [Staphylococcus agnetis]UXU56323.1 DUF443 domain-containing protein [Staphylococcus agnetis]UXU63298.1 DUF443 domain-containing protein [Staphylococcus agnetis]UXU65637.1 DUF443 domain-containing protein [Staphylococcus agnetis]